MRDIMISRPRPEEVSLINEFFEIVLKDTFERNGISDLVDTLDKEIENKRCFLNQDMESCGEDRYFLIAKQEEKIIGTIEYGPANEVIISCTNGESKALIEIGTVFVHPQYQRKGVGNRLLSSIYAELEKKGIAEFYLDSGYKIAQKVWVYKFGNPEYHLKDYWGEDADHMVWRVCVKDVLLAI
ncbi:Acetyltransferase (GNAT) domain-containing protein [Geosporobacter subterraneus DSM 17957]|uniref:Acetyltransferase (GNAT) domain-containing protein n=1 Tax=Geosporobacter subterraneus DSM 17957 TaxID=1121919 RepID=A0A1M6I8P6_9FIRM|nr:GNAT family N-acetyltransferase [Geosporobacter subterraneus]SHJ30824.1 Acetyltransferase (GNAT) domain-containing protein [Geosporobacter subterraneus DSM 17957]